MKHDFEKLFSVPEANGLVPRLELLVRGVQTSASLLRDKIAAASEAHPCGQPSGAELEEIIKNNPEMCNLAEKIADLASQIQDLGCFLKDIQLGLVDFPYEHDDEVVFLCWQTGEPEITAWHRIDDGFGGRKPLCGTTKTLLN